jgi:hypothetical protein
MQSTTMVALRTTIMMVCLVAVPLAAVMGTALPRFVASVLDGRGGQTTASQTTATQTTATQTTAANAVGPPLPSPASMHEPASLPGDSPAAGQRPTAHITAVRPVPDSPSEPSPGLRSPGSASLHAAVTGVQPAGDEPAADEPAAEETPPPRSPRREAASRPRYSTARYGPSGRAPRRGRRGSVPLKQEGRSAEFAEGPHETGLFKTGYSTDGAAPSDSAATPGSGERPLVKVEHEAARPAASAADASDPFASSEQRLRALGATYYRLESWGDRGEFYRCACDLRLGSRSRASRHFEAIEPTASQAVASVIDQVERHGRRVK